MFVDTYLPRMRGLAPLRHLNEQGHHLPAIMITGNSDLPMAVEAMKACAVDFIESCGFRFIPAGYSDLKPATVPI